jgi:hypothetical protein
MHILKIKEKKKMEKKKIIYVKVLVCFWMTEQQFPPMKEQILFSMISFTVIFLCFLAFWKEVKACTWSDLISE